MQRRNTSQRQIVYEALDVLGHATTEELIDYIKKNYDQISLATIYRNISILLDEHKIKRVKLQDDDVLETIKQNHYHFVCQKCGNIYDVDQNKASTIMDNFKSLSGYEILECDIYLYGICQKCKKKEIN